MYQFIGCTQARTHTQREIETRTETRMLFFLSLAYTKVTVVGTTHPTQVHRALGNGDREAGKQEQRWQKIIVSQKSRDGKKNQGSDESRWRRAKKRGKKFNLVFVVFLLCKTNFCKKKSFTSVVDGRATENDGGAETESQGWFVIRISRSPRSSDRQIIVMRRELRIRWRG